MALLIVLHPIKDKARSMVDFLTFPELAKLNFIPEREHKIFTHLTYNLTLSLSPLSLSVRCCRLLARRSLCLSSSLRQSSLSHSVTSNDPIFRKVIMLHVSECALEE